jgi:aminoglycoside phosphotransferase (APT) family kinase protein
VARYLLAAAPYRAPEFAHGDANITNCMFEGTEIVALLDYELSHLGLGEADLAYQLAGMAHFQLFAPPVEGTPSDEEMIEAYRETRGKLEDWPYARLFGEWRLATFAAMGMSRLSPDLDHVERAYWEAAEQRMHRIAPRIVPLESGT